MGGRGRDVGAAADAGAAYRAVPRRHQDRPCRAGHRRGRHPAAARGAGQGTRLLGGPLPGRTACRAARPADDLRTAVVQAAANGARHYLARPNIVHLHGVTGAMAVEILTGHIPATEATAALAQVHAEHAALYAGVEPVDEPRPASPPGGELTGAAVHSLDPHQVELVEACQRGLAATGDPAFAAAAETVTGLR